MWINTAGKVQGRCSGTVSQRLLLSEPDRVSARFIFCPCTGENKVCRPLGVMLVSFFISLIVQLLFPMKLIWSGSTK